ncbi:spermidine/putrescine import ATP-binding protein PotA [Arthrobacter sp. Hiyo4]|nr:spermidine/putrescine import ATP-binding protein PotA [Arthrobacter sp. Hiyo4]
MNTKTAATLSAAASSQDEPTLVVDQVSKDFGAGNAVDGVSFTLEKGQFLTMLGPSGSGKSTTLNMIAGFLEPDSGSIKLRGRELTSLAPEKRNIGMVFQNYSLFPHMSVVRNVAFPLEVRGVPKKEAISKAHKALELVELSARAGFSPRQLSGGQQQRVALARAIVFEPELLLMDEPLGALDKRLRESMQIEIKRISKELGATVVFVTHDQEEALTMSDQIAIYNNGRVEQFGTSEDLYERPTSVFVANFMGESNLVQGKLSQGMLRAGSANLAVPSDALRRFAEGTGLGMILRPEQVLISPEHMAGAAGASMPGIIRDVIYLGTSYRYYVSTDAGFDVQSRVPRQHEHSTLRTGDRVSVSWSPEHVAVVPALQD